MTTQRCITVVACQLVSMLQLSMATWTFCGCCSRHKGRCDNSSCGLQLGCLYVVRFLLNARPDKASKEDGEAGSSFVACSSASPHGSGAAFVESNPSRRSHSTRIDCCLNKDIRKLSGCLSRLELSANSE
ncbi:unnamed protein product [Durusdinium trenchii]|uniref:Secreted protein n=1 Tax=Durusdinium trenchii TaxID=1381693 RepID=A0ABP0N2W1_9DINO